MANKNRSSDGKYYGHKDKLRKPLRPTQIKLTHDRKMKIKAIANYRKVTMTSIIEDHIDSLELPPGE